MGDWEEEASVAILGFIFHMAVELPQPQPMPSTHHRRAAMTVVPWASIPEPTTAWWDNPRPEPASPKAAPVEETEPEPLLSVACHCLCNCERRPNRRITCERCNWGVGPGCCARNAEGGTPEIGATTCICHVCLTEGPPPLPNPQEEKELRMAAVVLTTLRDQIFHRNKIDARGSIRKAPTECHHVGPFP